VITLASGEFAQPIASHDAYRPLSLLRSLKTGGAQRSAQRGSLYFRADGRFYRASFRAGKKATSSDLQALASIISSIHFAPLRRGTLFGPFFFLESSTSAGSPGP
jgi:hypothetical protein